jgi:membrane protein DedA with SNARE-associated domain
MDDARPVDDAAPDRVPADPVSPTEGPPDEPRDDLAKPSRRTLVLLIAPIVILSTAGTIATAFTPTLATKHPLLLIALDARNRMLVLAREVDLIPFVVVGVLRRSLSDPLFYLLGRIYGDRAIRWLEKKGGGGELVKLTERWFRKASYLMVFAFPGAIVCALAGATRMRPAAFAVCNLGGTLASVIAVRIFSDAISSPVEAILGFFERNLVLTTSITVGLVVLSLVLNKFQGKLDADLEVLDEDAAAGPPADGG